MKPNNKTPKQKKRVTLLNKVTLFYIVRLTYSAGAASVSVLSATAVSLVATTSSVGSAAFSALTAGAAFTGTSAATAVGNTET